VLHDLNPVGKNLVLSPVWHITVFPILVNFF
jgi:hypothetical protein